MAFTPRLDTFDIALICAAIAAFAFIGVRLLFYVSRYRNSRLRILEDRTGLWSQLELQMLNGPGYIELNRFFGLMFLMIAIALVAFLILGLRPA
jgi:hypothetical protein